MVMKMEETVQNRHRRQGSDTDVFIRKATVAKVECIGVEKRNRPKHFVYVLQVNWSDGVKHPIYRAYTTFFDLRSYLKEEFKDREDVLLPKLPALKHFERNRLFGHREAIAEKRKTDIEIFTQQLLKLPPDVIEGHTITSFFETWESDFSQVSSPKDPPVSPKNVRKPGGQPTAFSQLFDTLRNKRHSQSPTEDSPPILHEKTLNNLTVSQSKVRSSSMDYSPLFPDGVLSTNGTSSLPRRIEFTTQMSLDQFVEDSGALPVQFYRATCDYKKQKSGEVMLKEGQIVDVLEKNLSGWWFVSIDGTEEQGWAPGAFLEAVEAAPLEDSSMHIEPSLGMHTALCDSNGEDDDEVCYRKGDLVEVLQSSLDGWWQVRCRGKVGYAPAIHLEKAEPNTPTRKRGSKLFHRRSMTRRGPPPRKSTRIPSDISDLSYEIPHYAEIEEMQSRLRASPSPVWRDGDDGPVYAQITKSRPRFGSRQNSLPSSRKNSAEELESDFEITNDGPLYAQVNKQRAPRLGSRDNSQQGSMEKLEEEDHHEEHKLNYIEVTFDQQNKGKSRPSLQVQTNRTEYTEILPSSFTHGRGSLPDEQEVDTPYMNFPPPKFHFYENINPAEVHAMIQNHDDEHQAHENDPSISPSSSGLGSPLSAHLCTTPELRPAVPERTTSITPPLSHSPVPLEPDRHSNSPWCVGKMSRLECEQVFTKHGEQRDFFIRESTNRVGDYTLSVKYNDRVRHFPIKMTGQHKYYIGKHHFKDLSKVVAYYQTHPLFYDEDDNAVQLGKHYDFSLAQSFQR